MMAGHGKGGKGTAQGPVPVGQVRIVGGRWRNTRLAVPDSPGLRPSGDRVRETLFNWLTGQLAGARVLDLFAGTGALGLEALSRGAASATLVERDTALARAMNDTVVRLGAQAEAVVVQGDALSWLAGQAHGAFDVVFVDPPFAAGLWEAVLAALLPKVAAGGWIYVESPADQAPTPGPGWSLHRQGQTREVRYALYRGPERR
ncbi:MAG: 16S rRNA (guanine(966)-N(2))-methyltransferase RsmD [Pseudoxanthomonas sp.]